MTTLNPFPRLTPSRLALFTFGALLWGVSLPTISLAKQSFSGLPPGAGGLGELGSATLESPPDAPSAQPCDCGCGKPMGMESVYLATGEFHLSVEDLRVESRGLDFVWARKYRSRFGPDTEMGNGWDYSYNIYIEPRGADLMLHDGNTRADLYQATAEGTFVSQEFFREGSFDHTGFFTLVFDDTSTWDFFPFQGQPQDGKIASISDRNGNRMFFQYDPQGRLGAVQDTLGRWHQIFYSPQGFIECVVDCTGRKVTYQHDPGGNAPTAGNSGDLMAATSPAVVGTPNGNDFPAGKTTLYTYSSGEAEPRLNSNLLTVTDPKGQLWLANDYSPAGSPSDFEFDRVLRQTIGAPTDLLDIVYVKERPSAGNNMSRVRAIVNDRRGTVSEYFFDMANRLRMQRDYTGFADPDAPTTLTANRPTGPVRGDDPAFFETRCDWNRYGQMTRKVHPNGNITLSIHQADLDPNSPWRSRGNLRALKRLPGTHTPVGDQLALVELFEYDEGMGGCCGTNFVTRHTDARGNVTEHDYDSSGNRLQTRHRIASIVEDWEYNSFGQITKHVFPIGESGGRREDVFTYYGPADGHQNGYMKDSIVDAVGEALTTTYEYDFVGNVVRVIDPRGNDTLFTVNQLDQVVRETSREVTDGSGLRYERDTHYDANDNVVRADIQNVDEGGSLQPNSHFSTVREYDILNHLLRLTEEVDSGSDVVLEFEYDANENLTLARNGEATNGNQPGNTVRSWYDERDLLFQEVLAEGDAEASTTQHDYDGNGNTRARREGLEAGGQVFLRVYDAYDRLVEATDPMGNVAGFHYNENSSLVTAEKEGELVDVAGGSGNVLLHRARLEYDAMDRKTRRVVEFFDQAGIPIGDGESVTLFTWTDTCLPLSEEDDNGRVTTFGYDSADRSSTITDAKGNSSTFTYDANSNVVSTTSVDKSDEGNPDEVFTKTYTYDNLDRLVTAVDDLGQTDTFHYDSRSNRVLHVDPLGTETRQEYDGLNRLITAVEDMNGNGASSSDAGDIVTINEWDDSSRLVRSGDGVGNLTETTFDALGRPTATTHADGTQRSVTYDAYHNIVSWLDARGTDVTSAYDDLDRVVSRVIVPGAGVSADTTGETYVYDGISRVVRAEDDDSIVTRTYDSLNNTLSDTINGVATTGIYDGEGNRTSCTYPSGRSVAVTYDELDRKEMISDGSGLIATYSYIGPFRVEQREYVNDVRTSWDFDAVRRITGTTHTFDPGGANTVLDDRLYTLDSNGNKLAKTDLLPAGKSVTYTYDAINRMIESVHTPDGGSSETTTTTLDSVGNRLAVAGGPNPGTYTLDPTLPHPADAQMNQYSGTPSGARTYDENGNLQSIDPGVGALDMTYDYRNQMVEVSDTGSGERHTYAYDAMGRRITRVLDADGSPSTTRYYYDGWQVVEERDAVGSTLATYVYGNWVDEVVNMQRGGTDSYFHGDDLFNVVLVTDAAGTAVERYLYGDFGTPEFLDGSRSSIPSSAIGNPYLFNGRRFDSESGLYYYRLRYLDPDAGRFTTRDPIGLFGDRMALGNPYTFCGNNPATCLDPYGREGNVIRIGVLLGKGTTKDPTEQGQLTADYLRPAVYDLYPKFNPPPKNPTEKQSDDWDTAMENELKRVRRELADADDGIARITGSYQRCVDGQMVTYTVIVSFYSQAKHFKTAFAENDIVFYAGHANGNSGNILQGADGESIDVSTIPGKDLANKPVILMRCSSANMADTLTEESAFAFGSETKSGCIPISPGALVTGMGAALDGKNYGEIVKGMNGKMDQDPLNQDSERLSQGTYAPAQYVK